MFLCPDGTSAPFLTEEGPGGFNHRGHPGVHIVVRQSRKWVVNELFELLSVVRDSFLEDEEWQKPFSPDCAGVLSSFY